MRNFRLFIAINSLVQMSLGIFFQKILRRLSSPYSVNPDLNQSMRRALLFASASVCLAFVHICQAGTYPSNATFQTFDFPDGTVDLGDGSAVGADLHPGANSLPVGVYGAALRLSEKSTPHTIGSFKLPDLDPGNAIRSFELKFSLILDSAPDGNTGEGASLNFGRIPQDNGTGENGFAPLPGGLTIAFDARDEVDDRPSIEVFVGGVSITNFPTGFSYGSASRIFTIHWDSSGLDIIQSRTAFCSDLPTPGFSPSVGDIFAFSARTTSATMDVLIDNLTVVTEPLPAIETGGPIISEFVADNSEFEDEFADKPGWIELFNGSASLADLAGWYLTDSKANLAKWKIERLQLTPYNYQVIFASKRDRQISATSMMHSNFRLSGSGGFVALVRPDGKTIASQYEYGAQDKNVAFGEAGAGRLRGYLHPASPGEVNRQTPSAGSFSKDVAFSHAGGLFGEPITLGLSAPNTVGAKIRYTLDRTEPGLDSPVFENPISILRSTTVRARVYQPGHLPGRISRRTFLSMDATLTNFAGTGKEFDSNLPLVFVDTFGVNVDGSTGGSRPFRPSFAVVIPTDSATGRARLSGPGEYLGPAGVHVRGESSAGFDQRSYALELWDESENDLDASLLGMPADSDWVLYGPWSEKTLMRNKLVFDWMLALRGNDGTSVRTRFIELFFNQTRNSTQVGYTSYRGIYLLMEKIKRGKNRLPIENLNEKTVDPKLITGGYIIRKDKDDALKNRWTSPRFSIPLQSFDPDKLNPPQLDYIRKYVEKTEIALAGSDFKNPLTGFRSYIDPDTFIDAQWLLEIAKQVDGYVFSTYFHKDRAGRLRAGPLWDFNISLGNADYATGDLATGWLYNNSNGIGQNWYPKLHSDPNYRLAHWDRYWEMRRSILATDKVMRTIDAHMATLLDGYAAPVGNRAPSEVQNPIARHFRKWPRLGIRDWPNPAAETQIKTWQAEVDYMKNWIQTRLEWLDGQSMRLGRNTYRPPVFSRSETSDSMPFRLTMSAYSEESRSTVFPDGEIFYTLDGSDPRLPDGGVSSLALPYTEPVAVSAPTSVRARLHSGGQWTPLAESTYFFDAKPANAASLVVSELMYHPEPLKESDIASGVVESEAFEYIELSNIAKHAIHLSEVKITDGIEFDFAFISESSKLLKPKETIVVVADKRAFSLRYPNVPDHKIAGPFRGRLDNGGEKIAIQTEGGSLIKEFRYGDNAPWPAGADGTGRSLVLKDSQSNPNPSESSNWTVSLEAGGSPGEKDGTALLFSGNPGLDSDGDGLTDLFEFATGSNPLDPASAHFPTATITSFAVDGAVKDYIALNFRRQLAAQGIEFEIDSSRDLQTWTSPATELVHAGSKNNNDGTVTETYRSTAALAGGGPSSLFIRLSIRRE